MKCRFKTSFVYITKEDIQADGGLRDEEYLGQQQKKKKRKKKGGGGVQLEGVGGDGRGGGGGRGFETGTGKGLIPFDRSGVDLIKSAGAKWRDEGRIAG